MSVEEQRNNPLTGVSTETMVRELVVFYGYKILDAALGLKCFGMMASISSTVTFLKKAEWARNKVEHFYLYRFKRMPKPVGDQIPLKPRERGFANGVLPKEPMELTVEKIAEMKKHDEENYKIQSAARRSRPRRY